MPQIVALVSNTPKVEVAKTEESVSTKKSEEAQSKGKTTKKASGGKNLGTWPWWHNFWGKIQSFFSGGTYVHVPSYSV